MPYQDNRRTILFTNWVGVEEQHRGSEDGSKHPVVQHSGGIHTEKVEGDGAGKVDEDGSSCYTSIDADPLISREEAGGAQCPIPQESDISC